MDNLFDNLPEDEIEIELNKIKEDEERYREHVAEQVEAFVEMTKQIFDDNGEQYFDREYLRKFTA